MHSFFHSKATKSLLLAFYMKFVIGIHLVSNRDKTPIQTQALSFVSIRTEIKTEMQVCVRLSIRIESLVGFVFDSVHKLLFRHLHRMRFD